MVVVVSRERLEMPKDTLAHCLPHTSLQNQGVMSFGHGIVDPGYEGRISCMLVNFGADELTLDEDDSFLRLAFHEIEPLQDETIVNEFRRLYLVSDDLYISRCREMARDLPNTFLDVPELSRRIAEERIGGMERIMGKGLAGATIVLSVIAILITVMGYFVTPAVEEFTSDGVSENAAQEIRAEELVPLQEEILRLEQQVNELENDQGGQQGGDGQ